jgi:serine protein kinase
MFAYDIFKALERIILDYVTDANDRAKYLEDLKTAKGLYRERIMTEMFNAYMDEPLAIRKDVMSYVNMIIGIDAENLGPDKMWKYKDPQSGELRALKIDERYINSVEDRLGLKTSEQRETFRTSIRKIYGQKISVDPDYDFMDNLELVKAVTDVRLEIGYRRCRQPHRRPGQPDQRREPETLRPHGRHHAQQAGVLQDLCAEDD